MGNILIFNDTNFSLPSKFDYDHFTIKDDGPINNRIYDKYLSDLYVSYNYVHANKLDNIIIFLKKQGWISKLCEIEGYLKFVIYKAIHNENILIVHEIEDFGSSYNMFLYASSIGSCISLAKAMNSDALKNLERKNEN